MCTWISERWLYIHTTFASNWFMTQTQGIFSKKNTCISAAPRKYVYSLISFLLFYFFKCFLLHGLPKSFCRLSLTRDLMASQCHLQSYDNCMSCHTVYYCWNEHHCHWYSHIRCKKTHMDKCLFLYSECFISFEVLWDFVVVKLFLNNYLRAAYKGNCIIKQEIVHDKEKINQ